MGKIIGIDLGTTNSVVSVMESGAPKIIANSEGSNTTPSVVAFNKKGEVLIGALAKRQAVSNPENTIYSIKRFMGRNFSEVENISKNYPVKVTKSKSNGCTFHVNNEEMIPEKISSFIIAKLKKDAEAYIGQEVKWAVITVPAYFNDQQRQATKDAGRIAGLDVKRVLNEPTAAALAYGLDKKKDGKIAVYDFGGGTFDISILEITSSLIEVKSTSGDAELGGDDFDEAILNLLISDFKNKEGVDLSKDKMALQRLKEAAEQAKIELSSVQEANINLPFITATDSGAKHLEYSLTRAKFEQLTKDLVTRSLEPCKVAVKDSGFDLSEIDEIILVGGTTRIPAIVKAVKDFFQKEPNQSVNPDQVVAEGAAAQAGIISGESGEMLLLDVTPLSLGIETLGGVMTTLIPKNTTIPTRKSQVFSTAEDNQTVVSIHILQGERQMVTDNKTLGRFDLPNIPPAPRGAPQIEVSFDVDANGIVNVSAKDKVTNKEQSVRIDSSRGTTSREDIEKMIKEGDIYREQDKKKVEIINTRNQLDHSVYQSEKLIKDNADKINEGAKKKLEDTIKEVKEILAKEENDLAELQAADKKLKDELQAVGSGIYKQSQDKGNGETDTSSDDGKKSDEPIDVN